MRILVAGALGEVGSSVAAELSTLGHEIVRASSRAPLVDLPDVMSLHDAAALVRSGRVDAVVNAAGRGDRRETARTGLDATAILGPACADAGLPAVLLSTTRVLEGRPGGSEDALPEPTTPYAEANARNEQEWRSLAGSSSTILRIVNFLCLPAGPETPQSLLLPWSLVTEGLATGAITVRSGPSTTREFVDAPDVAAAIDLLLREPPAPGVCASTPGAVLSLADLVAAVQAAFVDVGRPAPAASFGAEGAVGAPGPPGWLAARGWRTTLTADGVRQAVASWVIRCAGRESSPDSRPEVPRP